MRTISTFSLCLRAVIIVSFSFLLIPVSVVSFLVAPVAVEAGETFLFQQVCRLFGFLLDFSFEQTVGLHSLLVHGNDLESTFSADCNQIGREVLICRVRNLIAQDISFEEIESAVFRFQFDFSGRKTFLGFHIAVYLIVQTTF